MNETPTSWRRVPLFAYGWYIDNHFRAKHVGLYGAGHLFLPRDSQDEVAVCVLCGLSDGEVISQALVGQCARTNV
jgi:hypothetical protein